MAATQCMYINAKELAKQVSEKTGFTQKLINAVMSGVEQTVTEDLRMATEDTEVEVKLFAGVSVASRVVSTYMGRNPKTGESIPIMPRIRANGKVTKHYRGKLNLSQEEFDALMDKEAEAAMEEAEE